jgi:hypothetical protein
MRGRETEFKVGRRSVDGVVKLSAYQPELIQLSVSYKGERASSVVLTRTQVQALRQALAEYELSMGAEDGQQANWDQHERRVS